MSLYKKYRSYYPYIIAFLSFFAALFYNELNLSHLRSEAPERLEVKYEWVKTADDISYLRPAENYYYHGLWKDNNPGRQSYFLRTPGYGLFRYALMKVFGLEQSYFYFRYVQLLLFSLSVFLLFQIALLVGLPFLYALCMAAIYGLSPFASGFLYYSITEGITPALMIFYAYFLFRGYRVQIPPAPFRKGELAATALYIKPYSFFLIAALILGYIGITRPVLLLFGAALPTAIYWSHSDFALRSRVAWILVTGLVSVAPITIWAARSAHIAGEYVGVYPIYYPENNSQYRPSHQAIWEFEKSYGTEGHDFHEFMVPLWHASIQGDTANIYIDSIMLACPDFVKETIGPARLRSSYILYRRSICYQRSTYPREMAMPDTIPAIERQVINEFHTYTSEINSRHWLWCHVIVPLKLFKALSFHSNLSLYMFQHSYRGRWWMEGLRVLCLMLHFLCCISFVFIILPGRGRLVRVMLGLIVGLYFFYLCYVFRGLEERYTLPLLPLMLTGLGILVYRINSRLLPSLTKREG